MESSSGSMVGLVVPLALILVVIASGWKVFAKAGQPGWGILVPIYNIYLLTKIAGRPAWWLLLFVLPIVNLIAALILSLDLAKNFGKGVGFGLGLYFLGFIFYPILGFGDARYAPPAQS